MKNKQHTVKGLTQAGLIMALAAGTLAAQGAGDRASSAATLAGINIEYKMDPRVTRGLYMGERWITPPTYVITLDNFEIRAQGVDAKGAAVAIQPRWIPSDPEMVTVEPGEGSQVKITVKRTGESRLQVKAGGVSKELAIKAEQISGGMRVEVAALATEAPAEPAFKSPKEKLSYALGMSLVSQLRTQGVQLDADSYVQGFRDALSGSKTLLTETEASAALMEMQNSMKRKQMGLQAELAEKNQKEGEAFLAGNKAREGVVTLESGLQFKILKEGDGQKPTADDTVVCHYRGTLIDGTEFDSSYQRGQPATLAVNKVIKGWSEALQRMPAGSKWEIVIPPNLAYGARGVGRKIGPNATLIFEVELVSVQRNSDAGMKSQQPIAKP